MTPADLFEIRKVVVAMQALQSGDFDKEIARMEEASKASVDAASAEASRIMQQANQYLDTVQTKAKALMEAVDKSKAELQASRDKFEEDKAGQELQAQDNQAALRDAQKALDLAKADLAAQSATLAPRLAEIARKESNLEAQLAEVAELRADLQDKLARIRAIA